MRLHVSIPTFNRATLLKKQLLLLGVVKNEVGSRLSISVHDNSSDDETALICRSLYREGLEFDYFINPRNLGLARNLRKCIQPCKADYLWILGDDDEIDPFQLIASFNSISPGKSLIIFNQNVEGREGSTYFNIDDICRINKLDAESAFASLLLNWSILCFWISGFWVDCSIAQHALTVSISPDNMMLPFLLSGLASVHGQIEVSALSTVTHTLNRDQWSKRWGKLVMWTDKREIAIELVRRGVSRDLLLESGFAHPISIKQLFSLILRWPLHSFRSIDVNVRYSRVFG